MEGLVVNIFSQARLRGQLMVSLRLETAPKSSEKVKLYRPKLRDAYNRHLMQIGQTILDVRQPLDLRRMEAFLQDATDRVLGPGVATVLLTSAMITQR